MTQVRILDRIKQIDSRDWTALFGTQPLTSHAFLGAFEESGSINADSGWQPQHLVVESATGQPLAALPLYHKQHSYGEYVFDWSWANACHRAGIGYYPKLLTALPFTPSVGTRLGITEQTDAGAINQLLTALCEQAELQQASSWHLLFADARSRDLISSAWPDATALLERQDCQFHWINADYRDFDHFLARFSSRKRKMIRRERRRVKEQGISLQRLSGEALTLEQLGAFFSFYQQTYHQRGQTPYLNWNFFERLYRDLGDNLLLVSAEHEKHIVGTALFLFDQHSLYGRWWGGQPEYDCLHFEACYYQGIEFAIERKLQRFDPGTQGEHKLIRGFEPTLTHSLHWVRHPGLHSAVEQALEQERHSIAAYMAKARQHLPFKQDC